MRVSSNGDKYVVFLDIDNCLYSASTTIAQLMMKNIRQYFIEMGFSEEEAEKLHSHYYREYGLAIRGLVKFHQIDPLDFNAKCDDAIPLESLISPNPAIRQLLLDIDRSKVSVWAATNAYITHAERVLKILELRDLVDGIVYCDYVNPTFTCKPEPQYYEMAMKQASLDPSVPSDRAKCVFVDDSLPNVRASKLFGFKSSVWFREIISEEQRAHLASGDKAKVDAILKAPSGSYAEQIKHSLEGGDGKETEGVDAVVADLQELRDIWPFVFREKDQSAS